MLYTGIVDMDAVKEEPIRFISIASEFDLPWLQDVAEKCCSESIDENNLKAIWQTARLYDCELLKSRCVEYAKGNPLEVLANGDIQQLQTVDPPSWNEFSSAIYKKARHE